jgi:Tfp pilus assembly protein FimT
MRGATLPELTVVTLIIGVLASVVVPPVRRYLDQATVRGASERFVAVHAVTRQSAILSGRLSRYVVDRGTNTLVLSLRTPQGRWDTVRVVPLGDLRLTVSQPTVTFNPLGVGYGASNTTVIFARGVSAETVTVSRTGRLRR